MLNVINMPFMRSVIMLNVILLRVGASFSLNPYYRTFSGCTVSEIS
jgi:hypothetical protein